MGTKKKPPSGYASRLFLHLARTGKQTGQNASARRVTPEVTAPGLKGFRYVPGADAAGADLDASHRAVVDGLDLLQVGIPGPAGFVVRVTDIIAEAGAFSADFAYLGHVV